MTHFSTVSFTGLDVELDTNWWAGYGLPGMKKGQRGPVEGPWGSDWARTQFNVPEIHSSIPKITEWILRELKGAFGIYSFPNALSVTRRYTVVVRFQDLNDALMFKLRDGHRAWETN